MLQFHLHEASVLDDLLHELNLHDDVAARLADVPGSTDVIVLVELPALSKLAWSVRSTVSLFDADAVELMADHPR